MQSGSWPGRIGSTRSWLDHGPWKWGAQAGGNLWRTTGDINDTYTRMTTIGFEQLGLARYAGPGHWNDPDMLEVGNGGMTFDEYKTHMSLWAILAAPLLAGNDLTNMSVETRELLLNKEVIAVDQDPLGKQGDRVSARAWWKFGQSHLPAVRWLWPSLTSMTGRRISRSNSAASDSQATSKYVTYGNTRTWAQ